MLDESAQLAAIFISGIGLVILTVVMGVAAGRRHQADRRAELADECQRSGTV